MLQEARDDVPLPGTDHTMAVAAHHTRLLASIAALAAMLTLPATALAGGTLHVDSASTSAAATCGSTTAPCATIDDAMTHATGGEQILVAAGTYPGATITQPVHLLGPAAGSARVTGTIVVQADTTIDGFDFDDVTGPAIRFDAPRPGAGSGASVVTNNTFNDIIGTHAVVAETMLRSVSVTNNYFARGTGATTGALFVHGEHAGLITSVVIERNSFTGYSGAAIDAGGVPGLRVAHNTATKTGSLLAVADSDGSVVRLQVVDNDVRDSGAAGAIVLGRGVQAITIERNRLTGGTGSALQIDDSRGAGSTHDVQLSGNDIAGFASAIHVAGDGAGSGIIVRGNRLVDVQRSGVAIDNTSTSGVIDARSNWWGRNAGLSAGAVRGAVDVSAPLQLVGVDAPTSIFVGGSGAVSVQLVGAADGSPEPAASGIAISFSSTNAAVDAASVPLVKGRATTLITAGLTIGDTTTTATLDGETVRAVTRIVAAGVPLVADPSAPGEAAARRPISHFVATSGFLTRTLRFAPSRGFQQIVRTNRPASVRTTYLISPTDARLLRLRMPALRYDTRQSYVIARVHTRAIRGTRVVTAPFNERAAFAIRRADRRIAVFALTVVTTPNGQTRRGSKRLVLPANAR